MKVVERSRHHESDTDRYARSGGPDLSGFRYEVREFCQSRLPSTIRAKVLANQHLDKEDHIKWQKILAEKGWFTGHWPKKYGGLDWSPKQRWIFENEIYRNGSPWLIPFGISYVAPIIYNFGTEDQRQRFLPAIQSSDCWWAQGFSEAGAGSDLAGVQTRAVRDGNDFIVNGTKLWTTMAHWADMMFAIVRTEPSKQPQQGLSFVLIDLNDSGVTIRPIRTIDECHHVNEVILDDVRIPGNNLIGNLGSGWSYSKFLLGNERLLAADVGRSMLRLEDLRSMSLHVKNGGRALANDTSWRRRLAALDVRLMALESLALSLLAEQQSGADPGARASALKLISSEIQQEIDGAMIDAIGYSGLSYQTEALNAAWVGSAVGPPHAAGGIREYLYGRAATIYGGSSEIQRNIIAKAVLGL